VFGGIEPPRGLLQCRFRGREAAGEETVIMGRPKTYSDERRRRAIDEVLERARTVPEVAKQLGIRSPESLRRWVRQAEVDRGLKTGPTTEELAEIKALRKEVADQQRTIEILKAPTSFFAKEADPR
jgi:transposase